MSKFLRWSLIFTSKSFWTIVFVFSGFFSPRFGHHIISGLPQVSPVYLGIEMVQPGKSIKMISQVESFLCPDKQGTPEEGRRIQRPKRCKKNNKDEHNSPKTLTKKKLYKLLVFTFEMFRWSFYFLFSIYNLCSPVTISILSGDELQSPLEASIIVIINSDLGSRFET